MSEQQFDREDVRERIAECPLYTFRSDDFNSLWKWMSEIKQIQEDRQAENFVVEYSKNGAGDFLYIIHERKENDEEYNDRKELEQQAHTKYIREEAIRLGLIEK